MKLRSLTAALCICVACVSVCFTAGSNAPESAIRSYAAGEQNETAVFKRVYEFKTTNNPDFTASVKINGNSISLQGMFKDDPPADIYINAPSLKTVSDSMKAYDNGRFTAKINVSAGGECQTSRLVISLSSGIVFSYNIWYDENDGWYFPDNGLDSRNTKKLGKIIYPPKEASCYYVSAQGNPDEIKWVMDELKSIVNDTVSEDDTDYQKALKLNNWVAENIYYDRTASKTSVTLDTISIYNVLKNKRSVCGGYANLYAALLETAGIRCVNIKGSSAAGTVTYKNLAEGVENHEWCAFYDKKSKRWIYADPCWNSNNRYENGVYKSGLMTNVYFDNTEYVLAQIHRADRVEERNYLSATKTAESLKR